MESIHISASVIDTIMDVTLTQVYVNPVDSGTDKELVYKFPLPSTVAVIGFECQIGDASPVVGKLVRKAEAEQVYLTAKKEGRTAAVLHQTAEDLFEMTLGRLKAGQRARVSLKYVQDLCNDVDANSLRILFPLTLVPRYVVAGTVDPNPTHTTKASYTVTFAMTLSMNGPIRSIVTSMDDKITTQLKGERGTVTGTLDTNKDLELTIQCEGIAKPVFYMEELPEAPRTRCLTMTFVPNFTIESQGPVEYIFIIDRSGSMDGKSMEIVRSVMKKLLGGGGLPEDAYINFIGFGRCYDKVWDQSKPISDPETKFRALQYVATMQADMGGTHMYEPLRCALEDLESIEGARRQLFLLTDGATSDAMRCIELIQKAKIRPRVFCVGIGNGVSTGLLDGLAHVGNGCVTYIPQNELKVLEKRCIALLQKSTVPAVEDVTVAWHHDTSKSFFEGSVGKPLTTPAGTIFPGTRFMIQLIIPEHGRVPTKIVLRGRDLELSVPVTFQETVQGKAMHAIAVKKLHDHHFRSGRPDKPNKEETEMILHHLLEIGVSSTLTSWVLEYEGETVTETPCVRETVAMPVPSGFDRFFGGKGYGGVSHTSGSIQCSSSGVQVGDIDLGIDSGSDMGGGELLFADSDSGDQPVHSLAVLLSLQCESGLFHDPKGMLWLGEDPDEAKDWTQIERETLLVIRLLEKHYPHAASTEIQKAKEALRARGRFID